MNGVAEISALKAQLRKQALARRDEAFAANAQAPHAAAQKFLDAFALSAGAVVAGYRPIGSELDPTPLMTALHDQGCILCVPVVLGKAKPLVFRAWTPDCQMIKGAFGAAIPATGAECAPQIVVTPLVGWDRGLNRLGYGGGFYDRTFAAAAQKPMAIGLAFAAQELPQIPSEPTDVGLSAIITEREALHGPPKV